MPPEARENRILIFIVCYNAQAHIADVLDRIPPRLWNPQAAEVLLIDDASPDQTVERALSHVRERGLPVTVRRNSRNLGYGGNQKLGYHYAIENGFKAVVLLHGDGQYAPEYLERMAAPILTGEADVVLGSRMIRKMNALKGGMPLYKFFGNIALTAFQNRLLRTRLSEFHTGYRAFRVSALARLPLQFNADDFAFDTDILIQCIDNGLRIREIDIPTYYGDEISHVNGVLYGLKIIFSTVISRLQHAGLHYAARFDYADRKAEAAYPGKIGEDSSHSFAIARVNPGQAVLDIGGGNGVIAEALRRRQCRVHVIDRHIADAGKPNMESAIVVDLDDEAALQRIGDADIDIIMLLDVLEHLSSPERFLSRLRGRFGARKTQVIITVPNVAFWTIRLQLLLGIFNYKPRGILDMTHTRLFTFASLKRLLKERGFAIASVEGIPAPFAQVVRPRALAKCLSRFNRLLIGINRGLFSYQIGVVAHIMPTARQLLQQTMECAGD